MGKLKYRPEIDGLRAVSVLAVLLFHAGFGFSGGYIGVDVFFVISGFLITSLVAEEVQAGKFRFTEFWERRIRRIFPALTVMVLCTLLASSFVLLPADFKDLAESAIAQTILGANFHFLDVTGYFQDPAELTPLLHTWSLAVEEQFYLALPLLLVLWKSISPRQLRFRMFVIALASFLLSIWGTYQFQSETFYLLPTRAWELMCGSLLALAPATFRCTRRTGAWLSALGLGGILLATVWYGDSTRFPGFNALLPCLGATLFIFANSQGLTFSGALLATRPAVLIGRLSYSLYLWHWPVLALLRNVYGLELAWPIRLFAVALSFVLAWLSWKFVETPLRRPALMSRRSVFTWASACSLGVIGLSASIITMDGFRFRYSNDVLEVLDGGEMASLHREGIVPVGPPLRPGEHGKFLLWGDSHAQVVCELVQELAVEHQVPGFVAHRSSTIPVLGTWRKKDGRDAVEWNDEIFQFVKSHSIENVILFSRWTVNIEGRQDGSLRCLVIDEQTPTGSLRASRDVMLNGLKRTVAQLQKLHCKIWISRQVPQQDIDVPRAIARQILYDEHDPLSGVTLEEHHRYQARMNAILDEIDEEQDVVVLDPDEFCFDPQGHSLIWDEHLPFYRDDNHLSRFGAEHLLAPMLEPVMAEIAHDMSPDLQSPAARVRVGHAGDETKIVR